MRHSWRSRTAVPVCVAASLAVALWTVPGLPAQPAPTRAERVRPGIDVLLDEQITLVRGRRVALLFDGAAVNERGTPDDALLRSDRRAKAARVELVGTLRADHAMDVSTSLDSLVARAELLLVDLQDVGARPGPVLLLLDEALRCAKRRGIPVVVLDRPNPVNGTRIEGPLARPETATGLTPRPADRVYGIPLRHAMTTGELAQFRNDSATVGAELTVVPVRGWRRSQWFDATGLKWRAPSPDAPSLASALLFGGLAPLQATNLSVGRGTREPFQRIGAPWLKSADAVKLLNDRLMPGVWFHEARFRPASPSDGKFPSLGVPGIRIELTDRERASVVRIGATLLWAIVKTTPDHLRIDASRFDELMGDPRVREGIMRGEDPDDLLDRHLEPAVRFRESVRRALLYR